MSTAWLYGDVGFGCVAYGLLQAQGCVEHSHWYARSSETVQTDLMQTLRLLRVPGETVVFVGAVVLFLFVAGMKTGYSFKQGEDS